LSADHRTFRQRWFTAPIFKWAQRALPAMSETERVAIEAGDVWWDAALFSGAPDWRQLLATPAAKLSDEEQAFLDGPVEQLCRLIDDWQVQFELFDLPEEAWSFIKQNRFFGMIIPKEYGGLGFSATAHSEVIRKLSSHSITAAVTVMVPNSLGPGELIRHFGTTEQKQYYLPRLVDGREVPCFGLTSPEAGSDAASMIDRGVVSWGEYRGERVLGIRLNWSKRYITLCPVATLIGLAFELHDPDRLLGAEEAIGITVALVPTETPGVTIGRRHYPAHQVFQNGPTQGKDVFLPIDQIIGGKAQAGQGWKMLMTALAAGRGISLPSLSAAGVALAARTTGAYARIREQFNVPIAKFEGVEEPLARIAGAAYLIDAARRLTCAGLDQGHRPAVIAAIMKAHATERMRKAVNDAMDIHGGKGVIDGPLNYLGDLYRAVPVAITVEGANILTRNLMIFGQGAVRCHPHLLAEMQALADPDREKALTDFDKAFWAHVLDSLKTVGRAFWRSWTRGRFAPHPDVGAAGKHYRQLSRYASVLAVLADMSLLTLGGALKRKEMLSARLGDILSELYLLSAVLKRFEDEGRVEADRALVDYCMAEGLKTIETSIDGIIANFPARPMAWLLRAVVPRDAERHIGPTDALTQHCAELITEPSETRERLTCGLHLGAERGGAVLVERAFRLVHETEPIRHRLRQAKIRNWHEAHASSLLTAAETAAMQAAEDAVHQAIMVDDFTPAELKPQRGKKEEKPFRPTHDNLQAVRSI
jgi:acyl-CoA dehydrogenase